MTEPYVWPEEPTPEDVEKWWGWFTMHPVHELDYLRECPNCEAGDRLRLLGLDPQGDGIMMIVKLVQEKRDG